MNKSEKKLVDDLLKAKALPRPITQEFIKVVNELLSGLDSVEVDPHSMEREMVSWGPVTPAEFKKKMTALIESYMSGHDEEKTRLVVKTKFKDESGEA